MINVDDSIKNVYKSNAMPGPITLTIDGTTYDSSNWLSGSLSITESLCSSDSLDYSAVESNTLEATIAKESGNISNLKDKVIVAKQTVNGTDVPLGTYTISDPDYDGDYYTKVKAYDYMKKFMDKDIDDWWNTKLKFPITLRNLLISLCDYVEVSYSLPDTWANSAISISRNAYLSNAKGSDLLGQIQLASGCFFHTDRSGVLCKVTNDAELTEIPYTALMEDATIADYSTPSIDSVCIRSSDDDVGVTAGTGDKTYIIQADYLLYGYSIAELQTIASNILDQVKEKPYKPFSAKFKALAYVETGDPIKITTYKGSTASFWLMYRKLSDDGLITDEVEDKGDSGTVTKTPGNKKQVQVLNQKMHEVKNTLDEFSSSIRDIKTYTGPFFLTALNDKKDTPLLTNTGKKIITSSGAMYHNLRQIKTETNSLIEQTAESIRLEVNATYETKDNALYQYKKLNSSIDETAESIKLEVSNTYETQANATSNYTDLKSAITVSADNITAEVSKTYETKDNASGTYLSKTDAGTTYATNANLTNNYDTSKTIKDTYTTKEYAGITFETKSNATGTYQTKTDASTDKGNLETAINLKVSKDESRKDFAESEESLVTIKSGEIDLTTGGLMKFSAGTLSIDTPSIKLTDKNVLTINTTNFTLDENGNANFTGTITGSTITGSAITFGTDEANQITAQYSGNAGPEVGGIVFSGKGACAINASTVSLEAFNKYHNDGCINLVNRDSSDTVINSLSLGTRGITFISNGANGINFQSQVNTCNGLNYGTPVVSCKVSGGDKTHKLAMGWSGTALYFFVDNIFVGNLFAR
jgi:hypothetical protein